MAYTEMKPKRKTIRTGNALVTSPGKVLQKRSTEVKMEAKPGKYTPPTYTPKVVDTGDPRYGPKRKGYEPTTAHGRAVDAGVAEAQRKKQDIAMIKGLPYGAGTTTRHERPAELSSQTTVKPKIQKINQKIIPTYKTIVTGKNAPRRVIKGGEDKHGSPANKEGIGFKKKFKIRNIKSFPKR